MNLGFKVWYLLRKANKENINSHRNNQKAANSFNQYFASVADNIISNLQKTKYSNKHDPINYLRQQFTQITSSFILKNTTTHKICKIINTIKPKNSHGYDEVSVRILKMSAPFILSPLTYIFNIMLSKGIFSDRLKYSVIKPLYKKGKSSVISDFSSYRPISLLTSFSKLF